MSILEPYQIRGAEDLARFKKRILGDECGLGKTRTALHGANLIGARRIGVICPAIVRPQWWREAKLMGVQLSFVESFEGVSPEEGQIESGIAATMKSWKLDLLIVDEFHFCKHRYSKRSRAVFGPDGLARSVLANGGRVWCLSGTPMPRNPAELYPALSCLWPKTLANLGLDGYMKWLARFCRWRANQYGVKVYGANNVPQLRELLGRVMLRRLVSEVAPELPPLRFGTVVIQPASIADVLLAEAELDPATKAALEAGQLPPMDPQLARYRHQIGDLKARVAAEMLRDEMSNAPETEKKVIFAYHRSVLDRLEQELGIYGVIRIDGSTTPTQREERRRQFETIPARRIFLGQIGACAVGLDGLQHVSHDVIIVEPEWKSDFNEQAAKRVSRLGQSYPVLCRFLALSDSLDEAIVRNHEREARMRADVTG